MTLPDYVHTLDGFRRWVASEQYPETGQIAYLNKEISVDVSPERLESHNKPKSEVNRVLGNLAVERDTGNLHHDHIWMTNVAAGLFNRAGWYLRQLRIH